jgi:tyrosine-protein kinase Etk/Wzc|tara:strand:+ start:3301 stop:4296 length:996 start_codon:yes stop_codon:yes gene_type:complete
MEQNDINLEEERQNLLVFIWKNRKIILMVTGAAAVVSLVISFFLTPLYLSQAVVFPAATSTVSFSEQRNAKASSMDFGEEEQAEQLVQILKSSKIRNRLVERFELFKNYDIDLDDKNKNFKLNKAYEQHIQFNRTRYGSIEIDVLDKSPELAATIANTIVELIDTVKNEMVQERTLPAYQINKRKKDMLEFEMRKLQGQMDSLSNLGVVPIESRANLFQAYNESKSPADRTFFKEQIDINLQNGAAYDGLQMLRDEEIVKLAKFEDSYDQAESDANTLFNHKFIVESAVVADKKDKPKKAIIVILATMGAFFFMIFALLIRDRLQELRKID